MTSINYILLGLLSCLNSSEIVTPPPLNFFTTIKPDNPLSSSAPQLKTLLGSKPCVCLLWLIGYRIKDPELVYLIDGFKEEFSVMNFNGRLEVLEGVHDVLQGYV